MIKYALTRLARQHSYKNANLHVGHYRLLQTDPILNKISKKYKSVKQKKEKPLPDTVLLLLGLSKVINTENINEDENDEEENEFILYMPEFDIDIF